MKHAPISTIPFCSLSLSSTPRSCRLLSSPDCLRACVTVDLGRAVSFCGSKLGAPVCFSVEIGEKATATFCSGCTVLGKFPCGFVEVDRSRRVSLKGALWSLLRNSVCSPLKKEEEKLGVATDGRQDAACLGTRLDLRLNGLSTARAHQARL